MTNVLTTPPVLEAAPATECSARFKWTVAEFDRLAELGAFPDRKFELLDGDFYEKMSQNAPHVQGILLMQYKLLSIFGEGFLVRVQVPLQTEGSKPEPDLAVVMGSARDSVEIPSTALLVVEIADSTLATDRDVKRHTYARAGVQEYWIVDLNAGRVEVRREPRADPTAPQGHDYRTTLSLNASDTLAPLAAPQAVFSVADVLP